MTTFGEERDRILFEWQHEYSRVRSLTPRWLWRLVRILQLFGL